MQSPEFNVFLQNSSNSFINRIYSIFLLCFDPHPDLPPRGKALRGSLAPSLKLLTEQFLNARPSPWGEMKGGKNYLKSVTEILKYNIAILIKSRLQRKRSMHFAVKTLLI